MRTLVPNEMLKNPAVSVFSAPSAAGPVTVAAAMRFTPDNTFAIGRSGADRPSELYVAGYTHIGGSLDVVSTTRFLGGATNTGTFYTGGIRVTSNAGIIFVPDNFIDIGMVGANRAKNLYLAGTAVLGRDPSANLEAATKQYADTKLTQTVADGRYDTLGTAAASMTTHLAASDPHAIYLTKSEGDAFYAPISGGVYQTQAQADTRYLQLSGGTLSGNLLFSADSTQDIGQTATLRPRDLNLGRNLTLGGIGARIRADFSSAVAARTMLQTTTADSATAVSIVPSGNSQLSTWRAYNASTPTNASFIDLWIDAAAARINSDREGVGAYLPMSFFTSAVERMRILAAGSVQFFPGGTGGALVVQTNADESWLRAERSDATNTAQIGSSAFGKDLYFRTNGVERLRILAAGGATMSLAAGTTNPYLPILDLKTPTSLAGAGVLIRMGNQGVWSVGFGTIQGVWWHAFTDSDGIPQWGYDGTRVRLAGQAGWTALPLQGGWGNYGSGFGTASYRKTSDGTVWLTGLIQGGPLNTAFAVMPVGFRLWLPADQTSNYQHFVAMTANGVGLVTISTNGTLNLTSGSNAWFDLSNLHYQAA